jgi:large subunit ribosomal protein L6
MSRIAKNPVQLPKGVQATLDGQDLMISGAKGTLSSRIHPLVDVKIQSDTILVRYKSESRVSNALAGTTRANIANMVIGVTAGYERKLTMVGVGYRAQVKGQTLSASLGFSHPIEFTAPPGITIETPSQTEIIVKGCDKQQVGQVAANLRSYRAPEPYKGKGLRYSDEEIIRKEAKKK